MIEIFFISLHPWTSQEEHNILFAQFPDRISTSKEKDEQQRITIGVMRLGADFKP